MNLKTTSLGIEFGSTRIKAVLIDAQNQILARGGYSWESTLENGYWTYSLAEVRIGLRQAYAMLRADFELRYGEKLTTVGSLGVSAMMHGFLPFDREGNLLTAFRTWRNGTTGPAAAALSDLFGCNIPLRWSIAHLDQAVLNGESYLPQLDHMTTLAGYVHWLLTGEKVLGVGDASGMFPIDPDTCDYDAKRLALYEQRLAPHGYGWTLRDVLPIVLTAGESAGTLTQAGALLLDPTGSLTPGIPLAPPEGDAGTGMTATNSVRPRTGNVSAGTSIFSMVVLERPLPASSPEIDVVTTPDGHPTAMVHCNNGTSDLNAWVGLLGQTLQRFGAEVSENELYSELFRSSLESDPDCGGTLAYNMTAGEPVLGLQTGMPLVYHAPEAHLSLPNFMRAQIYACFAALRLGMKQLDAMGVGCDRYTGHGGLFRTEGVALNFLAAALGACVQILPAAEEGGAFGMALLAAYLLRREAGEALPDFLEQRVFADCSGVTAEPEPTLEAGFSRYLEHYAAYLPALRELCRIEMEENKQ